MRLGFASDHRGYKLKNELMKFFEGEYGLLDVGTYSEESCDYPDYAKALCKKVLDKEVDFGVAICGSGIGISIACNKVKGIRCAKVDSVEDAVATRNDNDANIVAFGEKMEFAKAVEIIETFVNTPFSDLEKHDRRINKIKEIEDAQI